MGTWGGYWLVFLGAGIGGAVRHFVNRVALRWQPSFPWSTLTVNVTGGLLIGLLTGWLTFRGDASQNLRLFLVTGILGGYTTFSAFALDAVLLWERGDLLALSGYLASSVGLSIAGVVAGIAMMKAVT